MPVLRHLKTSPQRCNCFMCNHHKQTRVTTRWMRANPKKVTYLADGVSTNRHDKFNNQRKTKKTKK